jgi:glycosyltransferase involved in cell wall biosynthesis
MRILLVGDFPDDPTLGSAKVPHKLREEFRRLGHHCDALFANDLGGRPRQRHARDLLGPSLAGRAVAHAIRIRGPYDVIDVAGAEGAAFVSLRRSGVANDAVLISRSNGLEHLNYGRLLDDARGGLTPKPWYRRIWYPAVRLRAVRRAISASDRAIVLNEVERDYVVTRGWKAVDAVDDIEHGVSDRYLHAPPPADARGAGVLFCGTWDAMKGVPYLAAAFAALRDRPVRLTVLGGGLPEDAILADFPPEVRSRVSVRPRVPEDQVIEEYRRHDLLVMCSTYEGFGMVVPEAMSQGLPVVATPVGAARTLVRDGETGLIVPPRDPRAIATAICRMLDDSELRARVSNEARRAVRGLSWSATARSTLEVYERARRLGHPSIVVAEKPAVVWTVGDR